MRKIVQRLKCSARKGFSLIEVLVAMTILTIIVLIVSVIFQQTGIAWTIGLQRADSQSATRAVVGAISRDLAMIVDPSNFVISPSKDGISLQDEAIQYGVAMGGSADCSMDGTLSFWIVRPDNTAATEINKSETSARELAYVEYTLGSQVTRKESVFNNTGDSLTTSTNEKKTTTFDLGQGSVKAESIQMTGGTDAYTSMYPTGGVKLTIRPDRPADIDDYEIYVGSCGPDREWGTDDDIRPWVEGEEN